MNFISTFDELNKLYEAKAATTEKAVDTLEEYYDEEAPLGRHDLYPDARVKPFSNSAPQWWLDKGGTEASWQAAIRDNKDMNNHRNVWEDVDVDDATEAEAPVEEPVVEDEPRQVICECDKCGALVIKDEADIAVDEETDLVNVEDKCEFCEEANGYKIVGVVAPYESVAEEAPVEDVVEESLNNSELLKEIEKTNELKTEHESEYLTLNEEADIIDEDLGDLYRKTFDKPASIRTQQAWEDELNDDSISPERRQQLEKKFAQQRDWEAKHPDKEVK